MSGRERIARRTKGWMYLRPASAETKQSQFREQRECRLRKLASLQGLTVKVLVVEELAVVVEFSEAGIVGVEFVGGATSFGVSNDVARLLSPLREYDLIPLVGKSWNLGSRRGDERLGVVLGEGEERELEATVDESAGSRRRFERDGERSRESRGGVEVKVEFSGRRIDVEVQFIQFGNFEEVGVVGSSSGESGRDGVDGSDGWASGEGGVEEGVGLSPGGIDGGVGNGIVSSGRRRRDVEDERWSSDGSVESRFEGDCRVMGSECRDGGFDGKSRDDGSEDDGVDDRSGFHGEGVDIELGEGRSDNQVLDRRNDSNGRSWNENESVSSRAMERDEKDVRVAGAST